MAPKFVVTIPEELEDLNLQPVTMDRESDSPHLLSPPQAASLDRAVEVTVVSRQETDFLCHPLVILPHEWSWNHCDWINFHGLGAALVVRVCLHCHPRHRLLLSRTTCIQQAEAFCAFVLCLSYRAYRHLDANLHLVPHCLCRSGHL